MYASKKTKLKSGNWQLTKPSSYTCASVLFLGFKVMIPWTGGAGVGHLHPEHAVQAELHDLYRKFGGFHETFL
jgi:hypothetical protein